MSAIGKGNPQGKSMPMKDREVTSRHNPTFRKLLKLLTGQGVKRYGEALIAGPKQTAEILKDFPGRAVAVVLRKNDSDSVGNVPERVPRFFLSPSLFRELDLYGTDRPLLLVRIDPFPEWNPKDLVKGCTLFVPFQDPVNVGAVIRSAAAFGVFQLVLLKECAHPFHHKSMRAAGSALLRISLFEGPSIKELHKAGMPIITLSPKGQDIRRFRFPAAFSLLPGLEGPGLPPGLKGLPALSIPMAPGVESLNAATATAIALYVWQSQKKRK
jgi:tRNA G18 (ribose-2'-O)-methylase SpoU